MINVIDYVIKGTADIVINVTSLAYIILPYFKNGSLQDNLNLRARNKDFMPEGHVLQIFLGICEGVKAFHDAKPDPLAHRDLKTANICMSDQMEPVIVDLGSTTEARVQICGQQDAQRLQDLAEERCSIVYRAPELFSVQSYCMIDERTDIWVCKHTFNAIVVDDNNNFDFFFLQSLGCILYAICFFKCPFDPIYEKGDSVALAVLSGNVVFADDSPYSNVM